MPFSSNLGGAGLLYSARGRVDQHELAEIGCDGGTITVHVTRKRHLCDL